MTSSHIRVWLPATSVAALALYFGTCWTIVAILITPERKPHERTPTEIGFTAVQELSFESKTDGVLLRGWLVPSDGDTAVILAHGIHSNAWDCGQPDLVRAYVQAGFHVLLFDLRGHGVSGGNHAGLGLLERGDVRAATEILLKKGVEPGHIGIHGTSYGAGTALLAAAEIEAIGAVIADSSFSSIGDAIGGELTRQTGLPAALAGILMPGLRLLAFLIYGVDINEAAPDKAIGQIAPRPVLLIHGTEDSVIPFEQGQRLKASAGPSIEFWPIRGADHTQGVRLVPECESLAPTRDAYLQRVIEFFLQHL